MQMSEMAERVLDTTIAPRPLDLSKVAGDAADAVGPSFPGTIEFEAIENATVVADEVTLRRALNNLLENATRAAGPDGTVAISVGRRGQSLRIDVEDSGPGFGAGPTGTAGLGLVIVESLVRTHGGHLEILRSRLGGALMRLSLPAAEDTRRKPPRRVEK
jgi:signal transduction histidine kinase